MMKKIAIVISVLVFFAAYSNVFAKEEAKVEGTEGNVKVEGTIQGLLATVNGAKCPPGDEHICAGIEQTFVLVADDGEWYLLPTFSAQQLSPNINVRVRVEGTLAAEGRAINVVIAEIFENSQWKTVYSPEIIEEMKQRAIGWSKPTFVRKK